MKKPRLFCFTILSLIFLLCACEKNEKIRIFAETPFFSQPSIKSKIVFISNDSLSLDVLEYRRYYLPENPAAKVYRNWHPLMVYTDFARVRLDSKTELWVSDDLRYDDSAGILVPISNPHARYKYAFLGIALFFALLLYYGATRKTFLAIFSRDDAWKRSTLVFSLLFLVFLRFLLLSGTLYVSGNVMIHPTDENGYFQVACDIVHGKSSPSWMYTVGLPIIYMPFVFLNDAKTYFDIVPWMTFLNSLVISPLCLVLGFLILRRWTTSCKSFVVALLWILLPFVYFPIEFHSQSADIWPVFKAIFDWPVLNPVSYELYYIYNSCGHNGLSDTPSAFFVLLSIFLAIYLPPRSRTFMILGGIFAFACLVRVNNLLFAPLLVYIMWKNVLEGRMRGSEFLIRSGCGLAFFLPVFSLQLIVNKIQFGAFFTFPYILHPNRAGEIFLFSCLPHGIIFVIGCNYLYACTSAVALFFLKDRHLANMLKLWIIPIFLFFAGYPVVGTSPIRFFLPVYCVMLASFVCLDVWKEAGFKRECMAWIIFLANFVLISPCSRFTPPFSIRLDLWHGGFAVNQILIWTIPALSAIALFFLFRSRKRGLLFALALLAVFHTGSTWLVFALFIFHILKLAWDMIIVFDYQNGQLENVKFGER